MEVIKEKIKRGGELKIPKDMLQNLSLHIGEDVNLRIEGGKLIIEPARIGLKKLTINPQIIDELVENEDLFEPEAA